MTTKFKWEQSSHKMGLMYTLGLMKIINRIKCLLFGHKFIGIRAPLDCLLSWPGWMEWSVIKCKNGCGAGRRRKKYLNQ